MIKLSEELALDVQFMSCLIDKADDLRVLDCDSHFSEFVGVHQSKIKQGKLLLHEILRAQDREYVLNQICKKNSHYIYTEFDVKSEDGKFVFVHCTGENIEDTSLCRLTLADISRSVEKQEKLREQTEEMNSLIDLVTGGVCLYKVTTDMHIEAIYANIACCKLFGTSKESFNKKRHRLDELIHPEDKSIVFQHIGQAMATGHDIDLEFRIKRSKNTYIWCKFNSAIQRYDENNLPIFHAIITDITKIKEAENNADQQAEMFVKLFKNLPGPVFSASVSNPLQLDVVSTDFLKLIGYTRSEFFEKYGGYLGNLMLDREKAMVTHAFLSLAQGKKEAQTSYSIKTKSGRYLVVKDRRKVIDFDNGESSSLGILNDRTSKHVNDDIGI